MIKKIKDVHLVGIRSKTQLTAAVLNAAEMDFNHVVKATIFITDMNDFVKINGVYGSYFTDENAPARETVQVAALPKNVNIEISVIASK